MEPPVPTPTDPVPAIADLLPPSPTKAGRLWALTLLAATLAGIGSWLGGEAYRDRFVPAPRMVQAMGSTLNAPTFEEVAKAERKNASLANGMLGAVLALALGLAGGLARGSLRGAAIAGVSGAFLGLAAGVGASEVALPVYFRQLDKGAEELGKDVLFPLLIHGSCWSGLGAVAGAALALGSGAGRGRIASAALAGLIGAVLGTVAYEIIGALAFPTDKTTEPLAAHWAPRLVAKLSVSLLASTLAAFALLSPGKAPSKPVPVGEV